MVVEEFELRTNGAEKGRADVIQHVLGQRKRRSDLRKSAHRKLAWYV